MTSDALSLIGASHREVLSNGLTLLIKRDVSAPVVAIVTYVKAGYFDESDDMVGIAHVLEHMFFKGTPTRGVGQIARETKANGGYLNAHTIYDHTSYYTVLPSEAFVQGLEIQFDAYARSTIDADELARELEVIIEEEKRKRDTPTAVAIESLYALLHDRHRIRRWRIGEEHALRAMTSAQLLTFYRYWYQPSNTILSIVGNVDPDVVRREVMVRYGALPNTPAVRAPAPVESELPGFRMRDWSGDVAQQQIAFGWRVPPVTHPDAVALDLAGIALGTGRASRLYRAVRERQYATSVSAWNYTSGDVGVFVVHGEAPHAHARDAALAMWREIQAARQHGFLPNEVTRAQRITDARWLRSLETMDGQATYLASWEAEGGLDLAASYYDRLMSLDANTLHGALERHLDAANTAVISYHAADAAPLAADAASCRQLLREVEGLGSSVLPPLDVRTPVAHTAGADRGRRSNAAESSGATARPLGIDHGVHVFETAHGVPILILPRAGAPITTLGVFQRGGSVRDPEGQDGLARLTAHAMLKGTVQRSGAQIAEAAEELGASIAVGAGLESLGWSLSVPARYLDDAAALLADVVQRATFPDADVETERALAVAEVARARDDMFRWPMRLATVAAYGSHPYARPVIGTDESLATLAGRVTAVREFHARCVLHGHTVLALTGDVEPQEAAALLAREFDALRFAPAPSVPRVVWPDRVPPVSDARDKQQSAIALLFPGPARNDPARFAASVLSAVASGLGGRFFEELRDKQSLAYTVSAFPVERDAGGAFAAYIATSPQREDEARAGLLREFAKLRDAAPTGDELDRARHYLIGTNAIAKQSGASVLGDVVDAWLFGAGLQELSEVDGRIAAVRGEDVLALAQQYFTPAQAVEGVVRGTATASRPSPQPV